MKVPTAQEFISSEYQLLTYGHLLSSKEELKKFAELHVQAALKAASQAGVEMYIGSTYPWDKQDEEVILNSYPLTNIK